WVRPALSSILGYDVKELEAMSCHEFTHADDEQEDWANFEKLRAGLIESYHIEKRYTRKDGSIVWGRLHVSLLKKRNDEAPSVIAIVEDVNERRAAEQKLQEAQRELRQLAARLIRAQEEERQRISRELHDDIGQRLSLLTVALDSLGMKMTSAEHPERGEQIAKLSRDAGDITMGIHDISHQLHSSKLQHLGLRSALKELCR